MKSHAEFHEQFGRDEAHAGGSDRGFGFVFTAVFAILAAVNYWREHHWWPLWFAAAAMFLIVALFLPRALRPLNRLWTRFGLLLHRIVQPVVMAFLFFGTIVPMGFVFRAMGKDFLRRHLDAKASTYWLTREHSRPTPDSFRHQF